MLMIYFLLSAVFGLGWILRGTLCLRQGGCNAEANQAIDRLEAQIRDLETAMRLRTAARTEAWARRQGLLDR